MNAPSGFRELLRERLEAATNPALCRLAASRRVLMLQGPVGPLFDRLATWLMARGATVTRVVFQGGDERDCTVVTPQRWVDTLAAWPQGLQRLIDDHRVDCILLFGQSRDYHAVARELAAKLDIPLVVMEEGYFRPGFMTMELGGVNGYSTTLSRFQWHPSAINPSASEAVLPRGPLRPSVCTAHFQKMAWHAALHYVALEQARARYPHYRHHRGDSPRAYARYWIRSWARKLLRAPRDGVSQRGLSRKGRPYFLVPLQHDGDSQILHHSPFSENTEFILEVLRSFASAAPKNALLAFREHPMSRGGPGHGPFILSFARELGLGGRVYHWVEGHTPTLVQGAAGVVVINSTVGIQALARSIPLKALGDALYDVPGVTSQQPLDDFWRSPERGEVVTVKAFLDQLRNLTQVPLSAYAWRGEPLGWS